MTTFINNRSNESVTLDLSPAEILAQFAATPPADSSWLWYWIAKHVQGRQVTAAQPDRQDMIAFLADSFLLALGLGLKRPMIRLHTEGRRYKIYLSARGTLCFKSGRLRLGTQDPEGDEEYVGCLFDGRFLPNKQRRVLPAEEVFFQRMNADPVGFMAQASKDMCRCCYCYKALEDQRSKDVGYGQTCASHWGLPWGKTYDEKVPSFAQLWARQDSTTKRNIRGVCKDIRCTKPGTEDARVSWEVLGDLLNEAGWAKRPQMPATGVVLPAA